MTAEVALHQPSSGLSLPSPESLGAAFKLAQTLVSTDFVPSDLQGNAPAALACMLYGAELGLGPMQALQGIYIVKGKPTMSAELMRAVVRRAGHRIEVIEKSDVTCTLKGTRNDDGTVETITWTIEDARRAGLSGGNVWKAYPKTMLASRATTDLCRSLFADVIKGISYTPDEADSFGTPAGRVQDDEPVRTTPVQDDRPQVERRLDEVPAAPQDDIVDSVPMVTTAQAVLMQDAMKRGGLTNAELYDTIEALAGQRLKPTALTEEQATGVIEELEALVADKAKAATEAPEAPAEAPEEPF